MYQKTMFKNSKKTKIALVSLLAFVGLGFTVTVNADSYTVKSGDTLSAIAKAKNTTIDAIAKKNGITNVNLISVGQVLEIDTTSEGGGVTTPSTKEVEDTSTTVSSTNGLSVEDAEAKEWIAQKESGGSYTAQNGQYYGRYQLTITYLNGDLSPENQEKVANEYVVNRYGSWTAAKNFWLSNGWY